MLLVHVHVKTKLGAVPVVAKAGAGEIDEDKLFISFYGQVCAGLLAGNVYYSEDGRWQDRLETEDLVIKGEEIAQAMVQVVKENVELERFERKLK